MNIVTVANVKDIEYTVLVQFLHDIYAQDIPPIGLNDPVDVPRFRELMTTFANRYAYIIELWATMSHEVRFLKRTSQNKDAIEEAMSKRDYLEKIMSAVKIKYYDCRAIFKTYEEHTA